ncbi:MAG: cation-translocating P-type ATPase [Clostridiales bacterium]|nr:cation-translocating P-type ATPase [Clostridiales bacterium]
MAKNTGGRNKKKLQDESALRRRPVDVVMADPGAGLNKAQVKERLAKGWDNKSLDTASKTTGQIVRENIFTYFNLIFIILAVLLIAVHSYRDLTFLLVIGCNTAIGIIQEIYSKKELDKMNILSMPKATVVREGRQGSIMAERLVRDDIVIFKAGNQICADAMVVEGEIKVNESLLTGESDEILKQPGDKLISGSFVVSGQCYCRLTHVGKDSYISKLTLEAKEMKSVERSEMIRAINRLLIFVGIVLIPIGVALFVESFVLAGETLESSITSMVAAVIGMIPEGIFLLTSVALAMSAVRLAKHKVLFHDMKSIETLARVDVLCVDKTGTITENTMRVKKLLKARGASDMDLKELSLLIGDFARAQASDNITMEAVKKRFKDITGARTALKVSPFSSALKYSGVTFGDGSYVMGAPEYILREAFPEYEDRVKKYTARGYRVLAFAAYDGELNGQHLTGTANPLGFIMLANPIRREAPETFSFFAREGVAIKVISGDNPLTVSEAAKEAKIEGAENYIDARQLKTPAEIDKAMRKYTVFGRVTPDQKRQFVHALKAQGHTVAMTGDGVNDVLALKDADCSIAMASGSDAAAQVAQVVLLDSDFSSMPEVVAEGRRVVNNIQRSGSLFLVRNIFSLLLALFSAFFMINYPLAPAQITLISMFTIGIPAFVLSFSGNKDRISGHFLPNMLSRALPAGITDFLAVGFLVICGQIFEVSADDIATASTMLLAIVGFIVLIKLGGPMTRGKWIMWFICIGALLFSSIFLPQLFAITGMSLKCICLFVVFGIATEPILRVLTMLTDFLRDQWRKRGEGKAR